MGAKAPPYSTPPRSFHNARLKSVPTGSSLPSDYSNPIPLDVCLLDSI